jgi:predicted MPP superfamily phosphohydrolase
VLTRRHVLKGLLGSVLAGLFSATYGVLVEPSLRLRIQRWQVGPRGWTAGPLRIAVLADLHMCEPWMPLARLRRIVARTNALGADLIVILGDLDAGHRFVSARVPVDRTAGALAELRAPLGVHAILGNHDWWHDRPAQARQAGPSTVAVALAAAGLSVLQNRALRLTAPGGQGFWLAGLDDQLAFPQGNEVFHGLDDLEGTLAQVDDDVPVILLAHEPDIFPRVPDRVALTLSGHTHGGQLRLFGWSPVVPSAYGNRYAYGPVREGGRDLVVSGGLGCSILPLRIGVVPEITVVEIDGAAAVA